MAFPGEQKRQQDAGATGSKRNITQQQQYSDINGLSRKMTGKKG
jgi:hypothetical protein